MQMLQLAIKSNLPLIHVRTDDLINVEQVLSFIAGEEVKPLNVPTLIEKVSELKVPSGRYHFTSSECKSLVKLYHFAAQNDLTIIFVNTEKSVLQFDGGQLVPPKELVLKFLSEISDKPDDLLPSFGGLTLKDVGEVARMTMTRDESLTGRGVHETRRGYRNLKGIQQISTEFDFYKEPGVLGKWLDMNSKFFMNPPHESLQPRGLLFDGVPGTGKTLAAKRIAQSFGIPLYRLDIGAMKGKYVGDSEGNLMAALAQVDQVEPCVVIFDEVEKIFESQGDSGVTRSMLSQILWWMQEKKSKTFVVMTTNDKSKIPPELYREGRIDKVMLFAGIEGLKDGYEFAKDALQNMYAKVFKGKEPSEEENKELLKRVTLQYKDSDSVPQSKLANAAYDLIREIASEEKK